MSSAKRSGGRGPTTWPGAASASGQRPPRAGSSPAGHPRGGRKKPPARVNLSDPDSRPQRTHRGFIQGYNAQAVTAAGQIVIAADLLPQSTDARQLEPMVGAACAELERAGVEAKPEVVVADAGYWNGAQIAALERTGIEVLVPPYEGKRLKRRGGRYDAMRQKLGTERGRALWRRRQQLVEPVFAETKVTRGAKRFQRRGLSACRAEWRLILATHNLLKLWRCSVGLATT